MKKEQWSKSAADLIFSESINVLVVPLSAEAKDAWHDEASEESHPGHCGKVILTQYSVQGNHLYHTLGLIVCWLVWL